MKPSTPLPWALKNGNHVVDTEYALDVATAALSSVANSWTEANRNAAYIAHAANAYPLLVETIADLISMPQSPGSGAERLRRKDRALTLLRRLGEQSAVLGASGPDDEVPPGDEKPAKGALQP